MEKNKSRWKVILLILLLCPIIVFFSACGGSSSSDNSDKTGNIPSNTTYTVHFFTGTGETFDIPFQTVPHGKKLVEPPLPQKGNDIFIGWYTTITCEEGTAWDFETMTVREDMTLFAKWQERPNSDN